MFLFGIECLIFDKPKEVIVGQKIDPKIIPKIKRVWLIETAWNIPRNVNRKVNCIISTGLVTVIPKAESRYP